MKNTLLLAFLWVCSLQALAADIQVKIEKAQPVGIFSVGVGSEVSIEAEDTRIAGKAKFLGLAINPDGTESYKMFLKGQRVYFVEAHRTNKSERLQTVLNPYEQAGGTCTGYAIYDFLQQLQLSGFTGNGKLDQRLIDEKSRTYLLVDNIHEYYLTPKHQYSIKGILNKYGKEFGFGCIYYKSDSAEKIKNRILDHVKTGAPVMFEFNTRMEMVDSPLHLKKLDDKKAMDQRLWIPRLIGEKNGGGHTIVIIAAFEHEDENYVVIADSDWTEPRIWNLDQFITEKTGLDGMGVLTCKDKK